MKNWITLTTLLALCLPMTGQTKPQFCIAKNGQTATIVVDGDDWAGVIRAANDLGDDVRKVTGTPSAIVTGKTVATQGCVIAGTIGKSRLIDQLVKRRKIDVKAVRGQWESYLIDVVDGNLIIAGSDKRGTI